MTAQPRTAKGRRAGTLTPVAPPPTVRPGAGCYRTASGCTVIVDQEPARSVRSALVLPESALLLWHLSIAHRHRYPTWDEIADVRYELCPHDVTMAMLLPPPEQYVNANEHCFHLWQIAGKRMPLDATPTTDGNVALTPDGRCHVYTAAQLEQARPRTPLRKSHFATCPNAAQHRRSA